MGVRSAGQPFGSAAGGTAGAFGSASDGDATLDGAATVLGMVPVANVYTMTRDLHFANLTINAGVTLSPAGYRVFVDGNLGGDGIIDRSGGAGAGQTAGGAPASGGPLPGGVAGGGGSTNYSLAPSAGAAANTAPDQCTAGSVGAGATPGVGVAGNPGTSGSTGQGGGSGSVGFSNFSGGSGASGGNCTLVAATKGSLRSLPSCLNARYPDGSSFGACGSGGAGSRGYQDSPAGPGGGGGASGGMVVVCARSWSGSVQIRARGGAGAVAAGGGAGGVVVFVTDASSAPTIDVSGGAGGAGDSGGTTLGGSYTRGAGGDGGDGLSYVFTRERA